MKDFRNSKNIVIVGKASDKVAEWLRRWTANPFPSGSVGSNPILVDTFLSTTSSKTATNCLQTSAATKVVS